MCLATLLRLAPRLAAEQPVPIGHFPPALPIIVRLVAKETRQHAYQLVALAVLRRAASTPARSLPRIFLLPTQFGGRTMTTIRGI